MPPKKDVEEVDTKDSVTTSTASKVKLPLFMKDAPHSWFSACECIFTINRVVKHEERFALIIGALPVT